MVRSVSDPEGSSREGIDASSFKQSLNKIFGFIFNFSTESPIKLMPHFGVGTGRMPAIDTTIA